MNTRTSPRLAFFLAFVTHPSRVGAVLPTSRWAVRDTLDMADVPAADLVVELGPGTGVYTRQLLARLRPEARLVSIERDPVLARLLAEKHPDPRLQVISDSAENAEAHLNGAEADLVVSGLPFSTLPADVRERIFDQIVQILKPGGTALLLQYSTVLLRRLREIFPVVRRRVSLPNVPPAFLFACSTATRSVTADQP